MMVAAPPVQVYRDNLTMSNVVLFEVKQRPKHTSSKKNFIKEKNLMVLD